MARKGGIITVISICLVVIIAIATSLSLTQKDADIYTKKFYFLGVFDSLQIKVPTKEELDDEMEASDFIAIVRPTDEIEVYAYSVLQKVEIMRVFKGNEINTNYMWISTTNGIYGNQNWGISNLMYSNYEYLVFLNELDGQYYNDFFMGAIRLEAQQTWNLIDLNKEYTYDELKENKYFATDRKALEMLYQQEKYLLEKWDIDVF